MSNLATIGHNNPPSDEELLKTKLSTTYAAELKKVDELEAFKAPEIVDDSTTGSIADFLEKVKSLKKAIEAAHKKEKDSFLKLGKIVDGFKNGNINRLDTLSKDAADKQFKYLEAKAQAERERIRLAAELERKKAEELAEQAEAHAKEGIQDTANELMDAAIQLDEKSDRLDAYASTTKDSKFAKTISSSGAVSGLRTAWAGDIENIGAVDLEKIRNYLKEDHIQLAVNAFVKDGGRELAGVKIHQKSTLR
jgi:hypothetical protein